MALYSGSLHGSLAHAAFANDNPHAGFPDEVLFKLFHPHTGGGADGNHFKGILFSLLGPDNRTGMKDCAAADIDGQGASLFNERRCATSRQVVMLPFKYTISPIWISAKSSALIGVVKIFFPSLISNIITSPPNVL